MWYEYLDNNNLICSLYSSVPTLENVDISAIRILSEGPTLRVGFDLARFADYPLKEWHPSYNTVRLTLVFLSVQDLRWKGWDIDNIGDISITQEDSGRYFIVVKTDQMKMTFTAGKISTDCIDGVCREDRI